MIDMSNLYSLPYYEWILERFNSSDCKWSKFKRVQLKVSKLKCPICECNLNSSLQRPSNNGLTTISATIDHYRPKDNDLYPKLKCDDKNYLLMCSDCNNAYKGNLFPLHSSGNNRNTQAISTLSISNEKPLIVNPIYDDLLELFILVFTLTPSGKKVLELQPKETTGYLYEKAKETIKLFSLGSCEVDVHPNINVQNCRIELLHNHFIKFYDFIQALREKDKNKALNQVKTKKLDQYGLYIFIRKKQFKVLVPQI